MPKTHHQQQRPWLKKLRATRSLTAKDVAAMLGISQGEYTKIETGVRKIINPKLRAHLAEIFDVHESVVETGRPDITTSVRLVGDVGKDDLYVWDADFGPFSESHELERVQAPPFGVDYCAVRVRGDFFAPVYRRGTLLYTKAPTPQPISECLDEPCLVKPAGSLWVLKILHEGSREGLYRLESINPAIPPMLDVEIEWAAPVVWTYRPPKKNS